MADAGPERGERRFPRLVPATATRSLRLFATAADEPRHRRASDVTLLAGAVIALTVVSISAVPTPEFVTALQRFVATFPDFLSAFWQVLADLVVVWAAVLAVAAIVRRRVSIVRDLVLAAALSVGVGLVVARLVDGAWPDLWDALRAAEPPPWYPALRVAVPTAVIVTASPHLTRPIRRLGRWSVALATVATIVLGATSLLGALAGLLVALAAATVVHLALGSSGGRPSLDLVEAALAGLGVPVQSLVVADRQEAGFFTVDAWTDGGQRLAVRVYGRDAHDAAVMATLWRTVWYREPGSPLRFGRRQQVEHEALLTLFAREAGVRTYTVVTAGAAANDDAVLVLAPTGDRMDTADPAALTEDAARGAWRAVGRLHERGAAHGQVDTAHLFVDDGEVGLIDFRGAALATTATQRRTDEAQVLVTTVLMLGGDRALAVAREVRGPEGLAAVLPFLQWPALTARQRRQGGDAGLDLDALRASVAAEAGVETPALQQLRRITPGSIVRVVLPAVAVVALFTVVSGLDLDVLLDRLRDASWALVVIGVVVAQTPRVAQAISTLGASPVALALGPVYALQLAVSYVNIAVPTAAARIAVNIRFFQRHGVPPGAALAAGALDGFISFVVQALILVFLLLFTPASLELRLDGTAGTIGRILVLIVVAAVVAAVVVMVVSTLRRFVLEWARRLATEAVQTVRGLQSPRRLGLLFGGSVASEVLFAAALGTFVVAFGYRVGLGEVLLINISTGLLAGLLPVPGGVGVVEGGLIYGLVRAGVPDEVAFAAVILYRLSSFYLPPIWGFFAMRWLQRNEHL